MAVLAATMNKQQLNNEIILCRPAVRQAKVVVIRKILKKMKILKSCKKETVKEKKLKKSERLFKKVQLMKKVKDDDVTKFALRNANLQPYLQGTKIRLKENVLAHLAKHKAVAGKVSSIREKFENWETELPALLDSLGKKKNSAKKNGAIRGTKEKVTNPSEKSKESDGDSAGEAVKKSKPAKAKTVVKTEAKTQKKVKEREGQEGRKKVKPFDDDLTLDDSICKTKEKKIDDPFFIDKKVIQPKLHQENLSVGKSNRERENLKGENGMSVFPKKPFKMKRESVPFAQAGKPKSQPLEEHLHPSWAAKKVKLIKPFEGKKIVFSEE